MTSFGSPWLRQSCPLLAILIPFVVSLGGCSVLAPELCRVQYVDNGASTPCSAVAVGSRVLLTAEHCLDASQGSTITLLKGGETRRGQCDSFPVDAAGQDAAGQGADLALCQLEESSKAFPPEEIEKVSTDIGRLAKGSRLLFTGCGCNEGACRDRTERCPPDGQRGGRITARHATSQTSFTFSTKSRVLLGKVFISGGDSGGPVCTRDGDWLVGVVREGCEDDKKWRAVMTSLASRETVQWMCRWVGNDGERTIEGLNCPEGARRPAS
jgi:hypothetical protein